MVTSTQPRAGVRSTRWWSIPVALIAAALMFVSALGAPATAAPAVGEAYGYVYDENWDVLEGTTTIEFFGADPAEEPSALLATMTTESAQYFGAMIDLDDEVATSVWVRLSHDGYETQVAGPYWVTVDDGYVGEYSLARDTSTFGTLSGRVLRPDGSPLAWDGHVDIYADGGTEDDYWDFQSSTVHTDESGDWSAMVPPGDYRIHISDDNDDWRSAWIGTGATSYTTAQTFTVTEQAVTPVPTVTLFDGASISGIVTDASGDPIRGISVGAFIEDGDYVASATTNAKGQYRMRGLDSGSHRVLFSDSADEYTSKWYANGTSYDSATDLALTENQARTGVNIALAKSSAAPPAYRVRGAVVDAAGKGQRGAYVTAYRKDDGDWEWQDAVMVRKDGTYGFFDLPDGQYIFGASEDEETFEDVYHGNAYTQEKAKVVTVGPTGTTNLGTLVVTLLGTISGKVTVPSATGYPNLSRWVELYDADGDFVTQPEISADGGFSVRVVPGTYTMQFSAHRYDDDDVESIFYVSQWWKGAFSGATATKIKLGAGGTVSGINVTLGRALTPVVAPRVSGTATTGKTLKVSSGTWSRQASTLYSYQWKVGGVNAGTGTSYKVRSTDRGKAITVVVTARDKYDRYSPGGATTKAVIAKEVAKVSLTAKGAKKKAKVTVKLSLPGTAAARTTGTVTILDGAKRVKTVKVKKGKAAVTLKLKKGKHRLKAVYSGSGQYTAAQALRRVKVK